MEAMAQAQLTPEELRRHEISAILDALEGLVAALHRLRGASEGLRLPLQQADEAIARLRALVVKGETE